MLLASSGKGLVTKGYAFRGAVPNPGAVRFRTRLRV